MSVPSGSEDHIFARAVKQWGRAQILFDSPAWNGEPVARHLAEILKDRHDLEIRLIELLNHKNQLVVAYSLLTLQMMDSAGLENLHADLLQREGKIFRVRGCFADKIELGALARQVQKQWHATHQSERKSCDSGGRPLGE
jgi:hypothetical protein